MRDLALREENIPFINFVDKDGYVTGYFRDYYDHLESMLLGIAGGEYEDNKIDEIILSVYSHGNKTLPCYEYIGAEIQEHNMEIIMDLATIEQVARCSTCSQRDQCWLQGKDLTYAQWLDGEGLTLLGQRNIDDCTVDSENTIYCMYDYESSYRNVNVPPMWQRVLDKVRRLGYALEINENDVEYFCNGDFELNGKSKLFNDCQVILFPQFDRNVSLTPNSLLMLTG